MYPGTLALSETGKLLPVTSQRFAAVDPLPLPGGGFRVTLKGAPMEKVTVGAVDMGMGMASASVDSASDSMLVPVYADAVIGDDGTAVLRIE